MIVRKYKLYKFLQSLPRSESPWKDIFINFIIELQPSLRKGPAFDAIFIIVDRYSKIIYFISTIINNNTTVLAEFIYDKIIKYHNISKLIISDRESIFNFK
jgi:hypothetical protein